MTRLKLFLTSLLFTLLLLAASTLSAQQTFKATSKSVIGFLQYLPKDYASNSSKYPVVIFLHGIGERGYNTTDLAILESGIWTVAKNGIPRHIKNGVQFPFIAISPQLKSNYGTWPSWYVMEVIEYVKTYLRIDEKRIHITGFSLGGGGTWVTIQDFPQLFASASPICGGYNSPSKACGIAKENLPVWAFHGDSDATVPLSKSKNMVDAINACSPTPSPRAKLTVYPGGKHYIWERSYALDYTYHKPNLYEWIMAQYNRKNGSNMIPSANAGSDFSASTKFSLSGSGSDSDGSISSYSWKKISGPSATISSPGSKSTSVTVSSTGTYVFRLQVKDNDGATDSDYVKVVVGSSSTSTSTSTTTTTTTTTNTLPTVSAGPNITMTLPTNSTAIQGSASDKDGYIKYWQWSKIKGPSASMSGASTSKLTVSNLVEGFYVFRLTVKDDVGGTAYDDMAVTVNASTTTSTTTTTSTSTSNVAPSANAGPNILLTLPKNYATVYGKATDSDGYIASWQWSQIRGTAAKMSGTTSSKLEVTGLAEGFNVFRLTVKDNKGAVSYDDMAISVSK
jgi:poly(3-hydroxybutyrate) depolymerase